MEGLLWYPWLFAIGRAALPLDVLSRFASSTLSFVGLGSHSYGTGLGLCVQDGVVASLFMQLVCMKGLAASCIFLTHFGWLEQGTSGFCVTGRPGEWRYVWAPRGIAALAVNPYATLKVDFLSLLGWGLRHLGVELCLRMAC